MEPNAITEERTRPAIRRAEGARLWSQEREEVPRARIDNCAPRRPQRCGESARGELRPGGGAKENVEKRAMSARRPPSQRTRTAAHSRLLGQGWPRTKDIRFDGAGLPTAAARNRLVLGPSRYRSLGHAKERGKFEVGPETQGGSDGLFGHLAIIHSSV